ncbi:cellulose binding domain-containing protein [Streptomyces sp. NPDC056883]|uniref:cellulose binding domain-containing protein n=1 Tax=Streptomyces sp. NPDC056883 TaxID=3345959 RepID=UPI0036B78B11
MRRRRIWQPIGALLVAGTVVGGGIAFYSMGNPTKESDPSEIIVRYRTDTVSEELVKPSLEVFNTSKEPVSLGDVRLRYYFTADTDTPYAFNCVQAAAGCSKVTGTVVALDEPTDTADHYLEVGFTADAGTLEPGANSNGIDLQLYRADHGKLKQSNDRSFDGGKTTYKESKTVTAYKRGALVWGEEPEGGAAAAPGGATGSPPAPAIPAGVMFDDFNYRGPQDPALFKHGWLVRTSKGGPGIANTWSADGISFPPAPDALGAQVLQLRAQTDGTPAGTRQAALGTLKQKFRTGTFAARIHFSDKPTSGKNGDHVNQTFFTIGGSGSKYSELDYEYMPNGGWGAPGPKLDTTSWHDADKNDRVTSKSEKSLEGWHTVLVTVTDDAVTYQVDGRKLFTNNKKYAPRADMSVHFNTWFVDLPFKGDRAWDMQIDWVYYNAAGGQSTQEVEAAVKGFSDGGLRYFDTVPAPAS